MKRIAIVEYSVPNHYSAVNSVCKIIRESSPDCTISLFVSPAVYELVRELVVSGEGINYFVFDPDVDAELDGTLEKLSGAAFDMIVFTSIYADSKKIYRLQTDALIVYGVHNELLRFIDKSFFSLVYSAIFICFATANKPQRISRDAFYIIRNHFPKQFAELRYKQRLLRKVIRTGGKILFFGPNLHKFAARFLQPESMLLIPFSIHEEQEAITADLKMNEGEVLRLCIPGTVNERLRDYKLFFEAVVEHGNALSGKLEIVLAGKFISQELLELIRQMERTGVVITHFMEQISESEFSRQLNRCDYVLGNLKTSTVPYGKYAETGVLYSMIRYSKPGIFSDSFNVFPELESSVIRFNAYSQLPGLFLELLANKQRSIELKNQATINARKYDPGNYAHVFSGLLGN